MFQYILTTINLYFIFIHSATNNRDVRKSTFWNVEENHFPRLPNISFHVHAPSFIEKFFESHTIMFEGNAGLKPKEGEVTSRPWQWPIDLRGQYFSGSSYRIYLLGNPIIWWGNLFLLAVFLGIYAFHAWREQRGYEDEIKEVKGMHNFLFFKKSTCIQFLFANFRAT